VKGEERMSGSTCHEQPCSRASSPQRVHQLLLEPLSNTGECVPESRVNLWQRLPHAGQSVQDIVVLAAEFYSSARELSHNNSTAENVTNSCTCRTVQPREEWGKREELMDGDSTANTLRSVMTLRAEAVPRHATTTRVRLENTDTAVSDTSSYTKASSCTRTTPKRTSTSTPHERSLRRRRRRRHNSPLHQRLTTKLCGMRMIPKLDGVRAWSGGS
jgi:hypothetical protein